MKHLIITTDKKNQIVNITSLVEKEIENKKGSGICTIFTAHTTCAITTADLDPGTDLDFLDFLRKITPSIPYRHPHDPNHAPDHILSSIIGPSVSIPYEAGKFLLGTWQEIVLVELDGPRERKVTITMINDK